MTHPPAEGPGIEPSLDHLVLATPDLRATVPDVAALAGVRPVEGGRHVGLGTRNQLLGLGGSAYLEIIGPDDDQPTPDLPRPFGIDDLTGPRLVTWAVHPPDLDAAVDRARALGHDPGAPRPMSRRTPAGVLLSWRLTEPSDGVAGSAGGLVPFLIDWGATPHPTSSGLPAVTLLRLGARHPEPDVVRSGLAALGVRLDVRLDVTPGDRPRLFAVLTAARGEFVLGDS